MKRRIGLLGIEQPEMKPMPTSLLGQIDPSKYRELTSDNQNLSVEYKPLNFDALLKAKVFRVTNQGNQEGGFSQDPSTGFSLVSAYNDAIGDGEGTAKWPDNPKFYGVVKEMFETRPNDIGAHKYMQILQSARDLGIPDENIFLDIEKKRRGYQ